MLTNNNPTQSARHTVSSRGGTTIAIDSALKQQMEDVQHRYLLPHLSSAAHYCMTAGYQMFKSNIDEFERTVREHTTITNKNNKQI